MKRSPLKRKSQLARKPGAQLKRTKLRPVSEKRQGQKARYLDERARFLAQFPVCQCCGQAESTEAHHKAKRDGGRLTDWRQIMAVCHPCHRHIHANPEWSYEQGFLVRVNRTML